MTRKIMSVAIALIGIVAFANHADASCGSSKRVSAADSQCLEETHSDSRYTAKNHCLHEIKVKIDVKGGSDSSENVGAATMQSCEDVRGPAGERVRRCTTEAVATPGAHIVPTSTSGTVSTSWGRKIRAVTCCKDYASCDRRSTETYPQ